VATATPSRMLVVRSFDINKPGTQPGALLGGVAGGSMVRGSLHVGDIVEVRPGLVMQRNDGTSVACPVLTQVKTLAYERTSLTVARRGGLVGVGTTLDPCISGRDRLVGQVRTTRCGVWIAMLRCWFGLR